MHNAYYLTRPRNTLGRKHHNFSLSNAFFKALFHRDWVGIFLLSLCHSRLQGAVMAKGAGRLELPLIWRSRRSIGWYSFIPDHHREWIWHSVESTCKLVLFAGTLTHCRSSMTDWITSLHFLLVSTHSYLDIQLVSPLANHQHHNPSVTIHLTSLGWN